MKGLKSFSALAVFLITLCAFAGAITGGHLHLDDWGYTYGCPFVKDGLSWNNIVRAFLDPGNGGIWMPVTYVSYMLDISLFGGGWRVNHAVNVVLHGVNAMLVFAFLLAAVERLKVKAIGEGDASGSPSRCASTPATWACAVGALVWSLHPMRAEAVVWVASRKEELWSMFALMASLAWIGFLENGGAGRYIATKSLFALACLAKPTAVCFPVLAMLIQLTLFREKRIRIRNFVPMLIISMIVGIMAIISQTNPTGMERVDISDTTFAWRILNAAVSVGLYIAHSVVPAGIHMDYRAVFGGWPLGGTLGLVSCAIAAALLLMRWRAANRLPLFAAGWFIVSLLPVLGLLGVTGDKAYADRYTYLPAVALSLLIVVLGLKGRGAAIWAFAVALLLAETWVLLPVVKSFSSDYLAYSRVLAYDPGHWRALRVVGCECCARQNRMDEGIEMLKRSLELRPSQTTADSLAYTLACRGRDGDFAEVKWLGAVAAATPSCDKGGMMLDALGIAAMREGDDAAAVRYFSASLVAPRRTHSNIHAMLNLGLSLANVGRRDEALKILAKLKGVANGKVRARAADACAKLAAGEDARFIWQ